MSDHGRISKSIVKAIADALRFCNGNEAQYTPGQMPNAVRLLKKRLTQKTITQNGTYIPPSNYDGFDRVMVNVEGSGGDAVLVSKNITANGNYSPVDDNADGYSSVSVAVPGAVLQAKTATANGTVTPDSGYDGMSSVTVAIPNTYSAADNGKVVSNGQLVAQTARAAAITQNGTYDTTENNSVAVNVPSGAVPVLQSKTVTENGDYYPPAGVDGFSELHVNVSGGGGSTPVIQPLNVYQNGTYPLPAGVDGFGPVVVNVSGGGGGILSGDVPPTSDIGSNGDYYIYNKPVESFIFGITITAAARGSSYNFTYWGARDIQIVFEDSNGNDVELSSISGASCYWRVGNSDQFRLENGVIDGSIANFYEHNPLPGYWKIVVPNTISGYKVKALKICLRDVSQYRDYYRSFDFGLWSNADEPMGEPFVSVEDSVQSDWIFDTYNVFNFSPVELSGTEPYFYRKENGSWVLIT